MKRKLAAGALLCGLTSGALVLTQCSTFEGEEIPAPDAGPAEASASIDSPVAVPADGGADADADTDAQKPCRGSLEDNFERVAVEGGPWDIVMPVGDGGTFGTFVPDDSDGGLAMGVQLFGGPSRSGGVYKTLPVDTRSLDIDLVHGFYAAGDASDNVGWIASQVTVHLTTADGGHYYIGTIAQGVGATFQSGLLFSEDYGDGGGDDTPSIQPTTPIVMPQAYHLRWELGAKGSLLLTTAGATAKLEFALTRQVTTATLFIGAGTFGPSPTLAATYDSVRACWR